MRTAAAIFATMLCGCVMEPEFAPKPGSVLEVHKAEAGQYVFSPFPDEYVHSKKTRREERAWDGMAGYKAPDYCYEDPRDADCR